MHNQIIASGEAGAGARAGDCLPARPQQSAAVTATAVQGCLRNVRDAVENVRSAAGSEPPSSSLDTACKAVAAAGSSAACACVCAPHTREALIGLADASFRMPIELAAGSVLHWMEAAGPRWASSSPASI